MTIFYRFESEEAFISAGGRDESEYVKDGICFSVVGLIPMLPLVEGQEPAYKPGFHVNASAAAPGWDKMRVKPATPSRVFG